MILNYNTYITHTINLEIFVVKDFCTQWQLIACTLLKLMQYRVVPMRNFNEKTIMLIL